LAKELGFYQRQGLDIELIEFQGTPLALAAMISGDIDVGHVSTSEVIRLTASKGAPMRAIHSPDARLYFLIAARDEFKSVQALQGKSFAVARLGSVDHTQSMLTLKALLGKSSEPNGAGDGRADNSRASFGRRTGGRHGHVGRQLGIHPKRARCQNPCRSQHVFRKRHGNNESKRGDNQSD
jgi:hypothetical protein